MEKINITEKKPIFESPCGTWQGSHWWWFRSSSSLIGSTVEVYDDELVIISPFAPESYSFKGLEKISFKNLLNIWPREIHLPYKYIIAVKFIYLPFVGRSIKFVHNIGGYPPFLVIWLRSNATEKVIEFLKTKGVTVNN